MEIGDGRLETGKWRQEDGNGNSKETWNTIIFWLPGNKHPCFREPPFGDGEGRLPKAEGRVG